MYVVFIYGYVAVIIHRFIISKHSCDSNQYTGQYNDKHLDITLIDLAINGSHLPHAIFMYKVTNLFRCLFSSLKF
jgi:hypothetical protein